MNQRLMQSTAIFSRVMHDYIHKLSKRKTFRHFSICGRYDARQSRAGGAFAVRLEILIYRQNQKKEKTTNRPIFC